MCTTKDRPEAAYRKSTMTCLLGSGRLAAAAAPGEQPPERHDETGKASPDDGTGDWGGRQVPKLKAVETDRARGTGKSDRMDSCEVEGQHRALTKWLIVKVANRSQKISENAVS